MPRAFAWRARSTLLQWVMCSPSAIGSRQASSTIWARWRGGNLLRASQAGVVPQKFGQAALLVAAADAPDRGSGTFQARGHRLDGFARSHREDDASVLNLVERQVAAAGHGF